MDTNTSERDRILFLIAKRIISLETTKTLAEGMEYSSIVEECNVRIKENNLLIELIQKL
jgi:hypothetical protein